VSTCLSLSLFDAPSLPFYWLMAAYSFHSLSTHLLFLLHLSLISHLSLGCSVDSLPLRSILIVALLAPFAPLSYPVHAHNCHHLLLTPSSSCLQLPPPRARFGAHIPPPWRMLRARRGSCHGMDAKTSHRQRSKASAKSRCVWHGEPISSSG